MRLQPSSDSGEFVTYIHTDTQMITKDPVWGTGKYGPNGTRPTNGKNLNDFDAIFFYGLGEEELSEKQKADLLSFVHEDGKGYVGAHSAIDAFFSWPQCSEMMGAEFDNHPWGIIDAHVIVEEPRFPGMEAFEPRFNFTDEIYVPKRTPYSRAGVDVLARCDPAFLDLKAPTVNRTDRDFPVAWVKNYGRGRVFYSTFGHADAAWDDTRIQSMYIGALRWAMGLSAYTPRPHPITS